MRELEKITPLEQDFSRWYTDVVTQGNLIEYGSIQGFITFKPISYGIWQNIQVAMNDIFAKQGVQNVYLPLLIPKSYIEKEKDHVKGFAPELATITKIGDEKLTEEYVIRPTSEVLFGELFKAEVQSYNDLPLIYNQWANVVRWEKTTNPFLRSREFLWQEGHTVHSSPVEARKLTKKMIKTYAKFCKDYLAMPTIIGKKTPNEKFAGAVSTYTIEAMMKDGRALQAGTSHYLGQNFAHAFDVKFKNKANQYEHVYQTSWGVSTRLIGGLIMSHGDNRGIIIPPMIAPNQIDIIEVFGNKNPQVHEVANKFYKELGRKYRVRLDASDKGPGFKAGKSEIEGTPLRLEVGPRDLEQGLVTFVRRDTLEKIQVKVENVKAEATRLLKLIQTDLYEAAEKRVNANIVHASTYDEMKRLIVEDKKFVVVPFSVTSAEVEKKIKAEFGATARCVPSNIKTDKPLKCIMTGKPTKRLVIFARAY